MRSPLLPTVAAALVVGFLIGQSTAPKVAAQTAAPATPSGGPKPAYLVASSRPIQPEKMGPYRAAAGPLARAAGLEILASGDPTAHLLEGKWPHVGGLTIERYRSMDDLLKFWNSPGYQEAKKLRAGLSEMNFIVALEGR
jgi:uncharacterized protein (DUF1330 family)